MTAVEPGQVFFECGLREDRPARRVRVKAVFPYGSDWVPAGMAFIASLLDDGREMRLRAIKLGKLHLNPRNQYGQPRRQGYLLETVYSDAVVLFGHGNTTHYGRPMPSDAFTDVFETACGARGRIAGHMGGGYITCSPCSARIDDILYTWNTGTDKGRR